MKDLFQTREDIKKHGKTVLLVFGKNASQSKIYAYVEISSLAHLQKLEDAIKNNTYMNFDEFGRVILTGEGDPNEETQDYMHYEYAVPRQYRGEI